MEKIRELIAAMKSDRPQLDMIVEAIELLANQSPPVVSPAGPPLPLIEEMQSKLEMAELKMDSLESDFRARDFGALQRAEEKIDSMKNTLAEAWEYARDLNDRLTALEDERTEFKLAEESPPVEKVKSKKAKGKK